MTQRLSRTTRRWITVAVVAALILGGGLALDLANHGLAWQFFRSQTGEEAPLAQVRGMVDWLGNFTRPAPDTEPYTPIAYTGLNPYGVNTFLEQEVEPAKRERQLQMIQDAGFGWIRQEFPWEDIEIAGRGDFIDRRNMQAVGAIDAWAKYDNIVDLAGKYGVQIQARLSNPPQWAQSGPDAGDFAPPVDLQDYVNYAVAVATRYKGRVHFYQVWNEPNIYPEWGEQAVSPEQYTDLLCRTYRALKGVDPGIVVIDGALAPTNALTGRDLSDFIFLQRMYDDGAGQCFDIQSMQGYGLNSGPTDRRMRPTNVNFSRSLYIRDLMVQNGDAAKPIWISEAAWSPIGEPGVPTDLIAYGNYGKTTLEQAARFMPMAYQRMEREWPWVGVMNYWFFKRPDDSLKNQTWYYFRMVEPDFRPLPVYDAVKNYIHADVPTLYPGVHQESDRAITVAQDAQIKAVGGAQLDTAALTESAQFRASGTDVQIRWRGDDPIRVMVDGVRTTGALAGNFDAENWRVASVVQSTLPQTHAIQISADAPFLLDSVTVYDRLSALPAAAVPALIVIAYLAFRLRRMIRRRQARGSVG